MKTNQYEAWCSQCLLRVAPGAGYLHGKRGNGAWDIRHTMTCPTPPAEAEPPAEQTALELTARYNLGAR